MKSPVTSAPAAARRRIVARFEEAKATGAVMAIGFTPENANERRQFERLRAAGVVIEAEGKRFYLDTQAYQALRRQTRGKVAVAIGVAVAGALWALAS